MQTAEQPDQSGMVRRIAAYVAAARGARASEPARRAAVRCILDLLGAAAAAIGDSGASATRRMAIAAMGTGAVPMWFSGESSSIIGAAWANSAAASALDLDDGHRLARGHPGAAVIPTAFAVARDTGASLEGIINAIVIGYEVGITIGAARVTHGNTGTWSAYAATATAAALRQTSPQVLAHALAIAGESAPNQLFSSAPTQHPAPEGNDVKEGIPWSVITGLMALGLAERGHTGPRNVLDSTLHYHFPNEVSLGPAQHICNVYFKLYACCRHVHAPLDALLQLVVQHSIDALSIDSIEVETFGGALRLPNRSQPAHLVDIQYSIPYCLALAAIVGPDALFPLTTEALDRDEVTALARRVTLSVDSSLDARFPAETLARVTIVCGNQRFVSDVTSPRGESTSPLSWDALEAKFRIATRMVAAGAQQNQMLRAVNEANAGNLSELMAVLEGLTLSKLD